MATAKNTVKLSADAFILKAIVTLREVENAKARDKGRAESKGIHSVYSGFNSAFKAYFGKDSDPVAASKSAVERGVIESAYRHGGAQLYLPGEAPEASDRGAAVLSKMGL